MACRIIAEAGINHDGNLWQAMRLAEQAKQAGADAVKFQTFNDRMLPDQYLSESDFRALKQHCDSIGITFISTPFDHESIDALERIGVSVYKVASGKLRDDAFLEHVASKGKPMIVSTGMSAADDVEHARQLLAKHPVTVTFMHCVSGYPVPVEQLNLKAMLGLPKPYGLSDHTLTVETSLAAVAMGASVIEKHFTLSRGGKGPDHHMSMEPMEMKFLVDAVRNIERCMGDGKKVVMPCERTTMEFVRRRDAR